jgi:arsenite methyltransferase
MVRPRLSALHAAFRNGTAGWNVPVAAGCRSASSGRAATLAPSIASEAGVNADEPKASRPAAPSLTEDSDELARDYERISVGRQFQSGKRLIKVLGVTRGERVLDVGCGTGLLAAHIGDIVGLAGHVLGIDPLPLRIELAEAKAKAAARANVGFRVAGAYDLASIPSGSFDVVCLNAVFHWLPEKMGPMREFARVLRPGGRLGIGGGAKEQRSRVRDAMSAVLARKPFADHPRPAGGIIHRVDEDEMRALFEAAGFEVKSIEVYVTTHVHASADAVVRYSEASSFGNLLAHLPAELRPAAREALVRELAALAAPDGAIVQEGRRMISVGVRKS